MNWQELFIGHVTAGDCLQLMRDIPDSSIDAIVTDPPYGINYQSHKRTASPMFDRLQNDDNDSRFETYAQFNRLLKDNSVAVCFCSFKNYAYDYIELIKYFDIKNTIIWHKGGGGIGDLKHSLVTDYEMAIVAHKGNCPIRGKREGSVWEVGKVFAGDMVHPTEKPTGIIMRILEQFTDRDALVLDPYLGSGTTAVACEKTGRRWIGMEIDEQYARIAQEQIAREVAQGKLFV